VLNLHRLAPPQGAQRRLGVRNASEDSETPREILRGLGQPEGIWPVPSEPVTRVGDRGARPWRQQPRPGRSGMRSPPSETALVRCPSRCAAGRA